MSSDIRALDGTLANLHERLLAERVESGHWEGRLSGSALATAVAAFGLAVAGGRRFGDLVRRGLDWLAATQNSDGGWGDTPDSPSNISTTLLCWSAIGADQEARSLPGRTVRAAEQWLARAAGSTQPADLAQALTRRYGSDRTFSAPILAMAALAGRLGPARKAWRFVSPLPFELAACPRGWLKFLRLPVVSYALPALIAIGQARHHFCPTSNPLLRWVRGRLAERTLRILGEIQPASGGFLEAAPLTGFVVMCLGAVGRGDSSVVDRGIEFLTGSSRPDGSWPIDTNLATWVTTLAVSALSADRSFRGGLSTADCRQIREWLLAQQHRVEHPYTEAAPGGWAWTDLAGGVPDADDTAGALLALRKLGPADSELTESAAAGVNWLLDLQNHDGGVPTFCRGWGRLPFDRSSPDLTAHALAAWAAWRDDLPALHDRLGRAMRRARGYLYARQRRDGSWLPLWFGNQLAPDEANPTYGTARVVSCLARLADSGRLASVLAMLGRGAAWLLSAQDDQGGWGGDRGCPASVEETALATEALAASAGVLCDRACDLGAILAAVARGASWLVERTDGGRTFQSSPIGLYFARLWYAERLYPLVFSTSALARAREALTARPAGG